jgi:hypothetical protein
MYRASILERCSLIDAKEWGNLILIDFSSAYGYPELQDVQGALPVLAKAGLPILIKSLR